jgi:hypothetical protein
MTAYRSASIKWSCDLNYLNSSSQAPHLLKRLAVVPGDVHRPSKQRFCQAWIIWVETTSVTY